ncbi:SIMPL domain-containing protein [Elusimicrobiota bacterium]
MNSKPAVILAVGLIISSILFGMFVVVAKQQYKSIRVVGLGTKNVMSDIAKWTITLGQNTGINNQQDGYRLLQKDLKKLVSFLKSNAVEDKDIVVEPVNSYPNYGTNGISGYIFTQRVSVRVNDISKLEKIALNTDAISASGLIFQNSTMEYFISNLSELKSEILAIATKDAKLRAEEISKSSGNKVEGLISARSGVFQIRQPLSTEVSDYGVYDTFSKEKEVAVTVTAVFKLR